MHCNSCVSTFVFGKYSNLCMCVARMHMVFNPDRETCEWHEPKDKDNASESGNGPDFGILSD
jgi:hypothetical protein